MHTVQQMLTGTRKCALTAVWLAANLALATPNNWTGGGDNLNWADGGNWSAGVPGTGHAVTVSAGSLLLANETAELASFTMTGGTLTMSNWTTRLRAVDMMIEGSITHPPTLTAAPDPETGEWIPEHRIWLVGSNITIAATGKLNADYMGYRYNAGPGRGTASDSGAGHGAQGGRGASHLAGAGGPFYGEPDAPWQPGSGGGTSTAGREGGGAIRVDAAGTLDIRGTLTANGHAGNYPHGPSGSGGSIWLNCRTLTGAASGLVSANGGHRQGGIGGGGAGGRIALHYNPVAQSAVLPEPRPPVRFETTPGDPKGDDITPYMGTLYLPDKLFLTESLENRRFWNTSLVIPGFTDWNPTSLTLDNCAIGLPAGFALEVGGDLVLTNGARLSILAAPVNDPLTEDGAIVSAHGDLVVAPNSWIYPYADATNGATVGFYVTGHLYVAATGGIDADYKGYNRGFGPGTVAGTGIRRGGGGYGGAGSQGEGSLGGSFYGHAAGPIEAGSGANAGGLSGRGGGAIRIDVEGHARLDGLLSARGARGLYNGGAAGSGGGIRIRCRTLQGGSSGLLRADGGQGDGSGGSGGGGRIAVLYDSTTQSALSQPVPEVKFSTFAWPKNMPYGEQMGTLYLPDTLFISEPLTDRRFWHVRLVIPDLKVWQPAALTLDDCVISLPEGADVSVVGDLTLLNGAGLHLHAAFTNSPAERFGARLTTGGDLVIGENARLYPHANPTNGAIVWLRVGRDLMVAETGAIDAVGKGYFPRSGNANGPGAGQNNASGGGHGGPGGGAAGGIHYALAEMPLEPGSPGGLRGITTGKGGGAIFLMANGALTIYGNLTADGQNGIWDRGPGGSGGSIFLVGGRMTGTGALSVRGGSPNGTSGSGGGGRIAVWIGLSPEMVEEKIVQRSTRGLFAVEPDTVFGGTVNIAAGTGGAEGGTGSKIYYQFVLGTLFMVR